MPIYPANGLAVNFFGLPMVLNDGKAENRLIVILTNNNFFDSEEDDDRTIVFTPDNPITLKFPTDISNGTDADVRAWALMEDADFAKDTVKIAAKPGNYAFDKIIAPQSQKPGLRELRGWKITPTETITLNPGQSITLTMEGIVTDLPDGQTCCYCTLYLPNDLNRQGTERPFFNLSLGPILKSPTFIAGDKVGIGTGNPGSTLDVNGAIRARGGAPGKEGNANNGFFFSGPGDNDSGMSSEENGGLQFYANGLTAGKFKQEDKDGEQNIATQFHGRIEIMQQGNTGGDFFAHGDAHVDNDLHVSEDISLGKDLTVGGNAVVADDLTVNGDATVAMSLLVKQALAVTGDATLGGDLKVTGDLDVKDDLKIGGAILINGDAPILIERWSDIGQGQTYTKIPTSKYMAFIGGYYAQDYDLNEDDSHGWLMRMDDDNTGFWKINLKMPYDDDGKWEIDVVAIHRNLIGN